MPRHPRIFPPAYASAINLPRKIRPSTLTGMKKEQREEIQRE